MPTSNDLRVRTRDDLEVRKACVISLTTALQLGESVLACLEALADPFADTVAPTLELTNAAAAVLREAAPPPPGIGLHLVVDEPLAA